jgi:hemerythrin-like domain-containing protein
MATRAGAAEAIWAFEEHEHRDLARGINRIHDVACEIGRRPSSELSVAVLDVLRWVDSALESHIAWEETWLYPQIDARIGAPWATRAARFDHRQIREQAALVRADRPVLTGQGSGDKQAETRCHLFGLEALIKAHIAREERYLIPLLEDDGSQDAAERPTGQDIAAG